MNDLLIRPRLLGLVCAVGAAAVGLVYLFVGKAPSVYPLVNLAALVLGATAWLALGRTADGPLRHGGSLVLLLALALLLTAIFGNAVEGAARWVRVGPLSLQISLIVLPSMIVLHARRPGNTATIGLVVAAAALALQPDRAMAGALAAALVCLAVAKPSRRVLAALAAALAGFGATLAMPDRLPAVPYVDHILYSSFDLHFAVGLAVAAGAIALAFPLLLSAIKCPRERPALAALGGCWLAVVLAAALGNYPTPLVGYGGSAVLGYLLSVALLPSGVAGRRSRAASAGAQPGDSGSDPTASELRTAPAMPSR